MTKVSFAPTKHCLALLCFGAIFWLVSVQIELLYLALLTGATLMELVRFPSASQLSVKRSFPNHFALGQVHLVRIEIDNESDKGHQGELLERYSKEFSPSLIAQPLDLPSRGSLKLVHEIASYERGEFFLGEIFISLSGFLVQKRYAFPLNEKVKVYPEFSAKKEVMALKFGENSTELMENPAKAAEKGDFDSLRPYIPGEDLRNIEWKVTARRGEMISRNWTEDLHRHIFLLIDCGRRMAEPLGQYSRLDHALNAAIQLCHAAVEQKDSISLMSFSDRIDASLPETEKQDILPQVLETVYKLKPKTVESDYWQVFGQAMLRMGKRSLVILFSDLLDMSDSSGMLSNLANASREHLVLCVVLTNRQLAQKAHSSSSSEGEWYAKGAACHMVLQRQMVLEKMKNMGVKVLEADPDHFNVKVVESYLSLRKGV